MAGSPSNLFHEKHYKLVFHWAGRIITVKEKWNVVVHNMTSYNKSVLNGNKHSLGKCNGGFATIYLWGFYLCRVRTNYHFNLFCQVSVKQMAGWTPGITIKTLVKLILQRKIVRTHSFFQSAVLSQTHKSFISSTAKISKLHCFIHFNIFTSIPQKFQACTLN